MALTNYLTQSLLYVVLFYGMGVGLFGLVGAAAVVTMAVLIYARGRWRSAHGGATVTSSGPAE